MAMAGDSVVLCSGDGGPEWLDENYDGDDSEWGSNRYHRPHSSDHRSADNKRARIMGEDASPPMSDPNAPFSDPMLPLPDTPARPPGNFEFPSSSRAPNGAGGLQKQNSVRGSNSFSGELGSTLVDSSPLNGGASSALKGRGTGSIFFKTKLCCKFRAGTCPYNSSCNFAHGMDELRKPPPGWEEIVSAQEAERASRAGSNTQIQVVGESSGAVEPQRFQKTPRSCRKFYTEEGCPYGDRCIFMHDDQGSQVRMLRESNAISLGPVTSGSAVAGGAGERSSGWKSRVCNKWETTGHCPFGQKCHFVHGNSDGPISVSNSRHGGGVAGSTQSQRQGPRVQTKWKGPADEITTIYGDWIEEDEWDMHSVSLMAG